MDPTDNFFDLGGARADVIAALDASIAANPNGVLLATKQYVRAQIAAATGAWAGASLRWYITDEGAWTAYSSFTVAPAMPSVMAGGGST